MTIMKTGRIVIILLSTFFVLNVTGQNDVKKKNRYRHPYEYKPGSDTIHYIRIEDESNTTSLTAGFPIYKDSGKVVVKPLMIDSVLTNPGIGFTTFQCFNGDYASSLDRGQVAVGGGRIPGCLNHPLPTYKYDSTLNKISYPRSSIAYFRLHWSFIEPEEDEYYWEFIDSLLVTGKKRNQKLLLRIAPSSGSILRESAHKEDVPAWFRQKIGPTHKDSVPHQFWLIDHNNPLYLEHFGDLIREFGYRYDGHPMIEAVDVSICAQAGEGVGTEYLKPEIRQGLYDAYLEAFHHTPLIVQPKYIGYVLENAKTKVGWRIDCIGDLGFWTDGPAGWNHMTDYYVQAMINFGLKDTWEKAPVHLEICGTLQRWKDQQNYDIGELRYIIDESLKWHISSFNAKSSPVPDDPEWKAEIERWLKKMGYRLVLRRFTYPNEIKPGEGMEITSWWENKGVAPCYTKFPVALRLKNNEEEKIILTDADITTWLPGDNLYNDTLNIPVSLSAGVYDLHLGILDQFAKQPKVKLAIAGRQADGWYPLGKIRITK